MRAVAILFCVASAGAFTQSPRPHATPSVRAAPLLSSPFYSPPGEKAADDTPVECTLAFNEKGEIDEEMLEACKEKSAENFVQKSAGLLDENSY